MPLHDWGELRGWEGVHHSWMTELLRCIKPRLPEGYRTFIGTAPALVIDLSAGKPDVGVREWRAQGNGKDGAPSTPENASDETAPEPDIEVAVALEEPETALFVEHDGRLIAAVEIVSPRNKDRPASRTTYFNRYLSYLSRGVHLVLIDVHRRPLRFSFADELASAVHLEQSSTPAPFAISYRVGEPVATGGRLLAVWRKLLTVGEPLPNLPLPLTVMKKVLVDLDDTYLRAAADAYLS